MPRGDEAIHAPLAVNAPCLELRLSVKSDSRHGPKWIRDIERVDLCVLAFSRKIVHRISTIDNCNKNHMKTSHPSTLLTNHRRLLLSPQRETPYCRVVQ